MLNCLVIQRNAGKKSGEVKMVRNGDMVEAYQVLVIPINNLMLKTLSGIVPVGLGKRLATLWMLSDRAGSSCIKAKSTTMCSTSISKKESRLLSSHTMLRVYQEFDGYFGTI